MLCAGLHLPMMMVVLLLVALCCGPGQGSKLRRPIWYHDTPKKWQDAQDQCQSQYGGDLLTMLSQAELDFLDLNLYHTWVGRVIHGSHYHWGADDGDNAWTSSSPSSGDSCAHATYQENSMDYSECDDRLFFFCTGLLKEVFVPQTKSWTDAKAFCDTEGQGLITFQSRNLHYPGSPVYQPQEFPVWIGFHGDGGSWSWVDEQPSDFTNWAADLGSAPSPGSDSCVTVGSQSKAMSVHSCSDVFPYLCYNKNLVLLHELTTWEQAVEHCKNLTSTTQTFSLLTVDQNHMEPIKTVLHFAQTTKVWMGLRFLAGSWFWADNSTVPLPSLSTCPGFTVGCGALVLSSGSVPEIKLIDCSEKLNPLCYDPALYPDSLASAGGTAG